MLVRNGSWAAQTSVLGGLCWEMPSSCWQDLTQKWGSDTSLFRKAVWSKTEALPSCTKFKAFCCWMKDLSKVNSENLNASCLAIINWWMSTPRFDAAIIILFECKDRKKDTYGIPFHKAWVRNNDDEVGNGKHGVQHVRKKQILMQCYPLTTEAPEKYGAHVVNYYFSSEVTLTSSFWQ